MMSLKRHMTPFLAKTESAQHAEVDMFLETYMPALGKAWMSLNYYEIK